MTAVPWRDRVQHLRRLITAEGGDPDRIRDPDLTGLDPGPPLHSHLGLTNCN